MSHTKPSLRVTKDYSRFVQSEENRPVHLESRKDLIKSMQENGFYYFCPICVSEKNGKFEIRDGQHRFACAQKLGLPVWYIVTDVDFNIAQLNCEQKAWKPMDFVECYINQGNEEYAKLLAFAKEFNLSPVRAGTLLLQTIDFTGGKKKIYSGEFKIKNYERAKAIASCYKRLSQLSKHIKNDRMINALYACSFVDGFDTERLIEGASRCVDKLLAYSTCEGYLRLIEELYNYGRRTQVPIAIHAQNKMKERNPKHRKSV